ncbi:hypothetical protein B0T16DRAFT_329399 [Cercophora newfieldiana]|uniref:Ph domain-containing protein n=1 Tax=Cercophora newfieldiana TaxID=92897 RepID=A0AA39Y7W5_9PEZI|nr:hypothetical protein B0T16DRAFT_329399 [Cercophora newfieldiana]
MNAVVGILGKKALGRLKDKNVDTNSENPYMEKFPITNQRGEIVKYKERERPIPEGLSANDVAILKKVRRKAYKWDMSFRFCCFRTRFGWSFIVGLLPFIGDFADLLIGLYIVKSCNKIDGGLPKTLSGRMMWNIMVDFGIGLIPFVGDLADAFYRANTRNAWLLDAYLTEKAGALKAGKVQADDGSTIAVPGELRAGNTNAQAQTGRGRQPDVEMGMAQVPLAGSSPQRGRR